jgi:general secretion pathway protein E
VTDAFSRPSYSFAKRQGATIAERSATQALVICREDVRASVLMELRRLAKVALKVERLSPQFYQQRIQRLYESGSEDARAMAEEMRDNVDLQSLAEHLPETQDLLESEDDAPIIRLINALLTEAVKEGASDIHIEPFENRLAVRFRVDGVLKEVLAPSKALASPVVSRIKVMARLDIAEKRLPQDGRISLKVAGRAVDVRVSTLPSGHGERVVLRLLDKQAGRLDLSQLGMSETTRLQLADVVQRPHGIFLVTGPTGSGKTTTLYAALSTLNDRSRNIMTVEDPIEYYLDGIGQTQVNTKVDLSFARGLRAILRQDPDVVMVGEIRDLETAQIAVQASLTGHLVLSTLHTNSAVGAVTRLRDMGVEPFLLASSLIGVLAQRLVRVLDPKLREAYLATAADLAGFGLQPDGQVVEFYRPKTGSVRGSGYKGRTGIYELVAVNEEIRALIHEGAAEAELEQRARLRSPSILLDGFDKVRSGMTSVDEVLRVTRDD